LRKTCPHTVSCLLLLLLLPGRLLLLLLLLLLLIVQVLVGAPVLGVVGVELGGASPAHSPARDPAHVLLILLVHLLLQHQQLKQASNNVSQLVLIY